MKNTLSYYTQLYRQILTVNASKAMSFRANFILFFILDLIFYSFTLLGQMYIFDHTPVVGPWHRPQFLFFTSCLLLMDWMHTFTVAHSFWMLPRNIKQGEMDFIILRPANPIFSTFLSYSRFEALGNIFPALGCFIYFGLQVGLQWWQWPWAIIMCFLGFLLWAQIEMTLSLSMFWLQEGLGINFLRMQFQQISRWPDFIYGYFTQKFFTLIIPILVIINAPVKLILNSNDWNSLALLIGMNLLWAIILQGLWTLALKGYQSASS